MTLSAAPSLEFPRRRLCPEERRLACGAALCTAVVLFSSVELERLIKAPAATLTAVGLLLMRQFSKLAVAPPAPETLTPVLVLRLIEESRMLTNALLPTTTPVGRPLIVTPSKTPAIKPELDWMVIPLLLQLLIEVFLTNKLRPVAFASAMMP